MSDSEKPERPRVLGTLTPGAFDSGLGAADGGLSAPQGELKTPAPLQLGSRRRRRRAAPRTPLPRGAILTLIRSGGFVFRTTSVTIYRDGRVTYDSDGAGQAREEAVWLLEDAEVGALRAELRAVDWSALDFAHATSRGDAYSYELVARDGRRVRRLETAEGAIPAQIEPLIRRLAAYRPQS